MMQVHEIWQIHKCSCARKRQKCDNLDVCFLSIFKLGEYFAGHSLSYCVGQAIHYNDLLPKHICFWTNCKAKRKPPNIRDSAHRAEVRDVPKMPHLNVYASQLTQPGNVRYPNADDRE